MNRDEKNLQTRQKILDSALQEFSEKSYSEASLNAICAQGNLSKGIIYHYFRDKDALYLICVQQCFDALTHYLSGLVATRGVSAEAALANYFEVRATFFKANPRYLKLYYNVAINPPEHLLTAIAQSKADFDALNMSALMGLLEGVELRPDFTVQEVVEVFREYQDFVNTRFQLQAVDEATLQEHEARCRRSLKILLYGVINRE